MGIAEQNLVTVSAGLAACGKKVFAASPACFLSTRSYEQAKVDVAYSKTNVTLVGISGGVIACGEMVPYAIQAQKELTEKGINVGIIDMYCIKPIDKAAVINAAKNTKCIITVEEHSPYGGLGSIVAQIVSANCPKKVINLTLPDGHIIAGTNKEIFKYYGLYGEGIVKAVEQALE